MQQRARIGIMGGTFDPIHNGHLAVARSAAEQLGLQQVLFMPAGNPHFKLDQHVAPADDRARMVALAIEDEAGFVLDTREIERTGVTYTADTLEELADIFANAHMYFFLGTDAALGLPHWRRAQAVADLCTIVVMHRPGESTQAVKEALEASPVDFDVVFLDVPQVDVSSTEIRRRVADGLSVDGMVPETVAQYMGQSGLYSHASNEEGGHER